MDRSDAKIGQLGFAGTNGASHTFAVWATARLRRPLYWAATGYPATSRAEIPDLDSLLKREVCVSVGQCAVKVTTSTVGTNVCVKGAFSGRVYASPFDRAFVAFIDDNPNANWGHPCRYVFVKDDLSAFVVHYAKEPMTIEQEGGVAVEMKVLFEPAAKGSGASVEKTRTAVNALLNATSGSGRVACRNGDTSHSYAVLISGGYNSSNNHTRYWGDTATMYGLLTRRYGIPRENIQVFMSSGTSSGVDVSTHTSSHSFFPGRTSPLDLDGDGTDDVTGAATVSALSSAFSSLKTRLTANDQLFVFVTDHGGQDDLGDCIVYLWNSTEMSVSEFAALTDGMACPVVYALEFCYSGGFADTLASQGGVRVVATAASVETSTAWAQTSKVTGITSSQGLYYMDPWVYYFAGAAGGVFPSVSLSPCNDDTAYASADTNGDSRVSIAEAALYAKAKIEADGYLETPDYRESSSGAGANLYLVKGSPSFGSGDLAYLSVAGANSVQSGSTASLACTAVFDDGTSQTVKPTWSVTPGNLGTVSADGLLHAADNLMTNALVTVRAVYAIGGISRTGALRMPVSPAPPENDDFADAAVISGSSGELTATSVGATYETGEPLAKFVSTATASVWWSWTAPSSGSVTVSTAGSGFDTVLGVYTGTALASLATVARNDDATSSLRTSACTFTCAKGTRYYIAVAGYSGATGSVKLSWATTSSQSVSIAQAVDNTSLTFTTGGAAAWFGQTTNTYDGADAAQSGAITHSESTWLQTTVAGPGTITFWWKASSESASFDYLFFSIDGTLKSKIGGTSCSWAKCTHSVDTGTHTLKWTYCKDGSVTKGLDAGFVDQVTWTPEVVEPPSAPTISSVSTAYTPYAKVTWGAVSGATTYKVYRSTSTTRTSSAYATGITTAYYYDYYATPGVTYYYWVEAVNSAGSAVSAYASGYRAVSLTLSSTTQSFVAAGGSTNVSVTANTTWTASADVSWITFTTSSGSSNGTLSYTVAANTATSSRSGTITVTAGGSTAHPKTATITVTQDACAGDHVPDGGPYTNVVDGVAWMFTVSGGKATLGTGRYAVPAIATSTSGALAIPSTLGGCSVVSIGSSAFYGCSALTSVTIPSSVTSIGYYAFYNCSALTSVTIPAGVTSIGSYVFYNCSALTSVTIPSSATSIGNYAFYRCSALTSVTIPSSVKSIGNSAFYYCSKLTSVTIPSSVKSIGSYVFAYCMGLTSVTIPSSVTSIGDSAFSYCNKLASAAIPSSVKSIGNSAFRGCSALTSVTIPSSVTSIGSCAFGGCRSTSSIVVDTANPNYTSVDGALYDKAITTLLACPSGKTSVTFPSGVTSIGSYAFYDCRELTSVTIPSSVTSIGGYAFQECSGLTSVTIPAGVTSIGSATFYDCGKLASVTIPAGVTSIGSYAFYNCSALTSVTIPSSATSIGNYAFCRCSALTSVTIPSSVTSIGSYAFSYCSKLTSVTIPSSVTSIGSRAFFWCFALTTVYVDAGDATRIETLMSNSGFTTSGLTFVETFPALPENPTAADVAAALDGAADDGLGTHIATPEQYGAFRAWAEQVKVPGGSSAAGLQAVRAADHAWFSFAVDSDVLITELPTADEVKVEAFAPSTTSGRFDFTVGIDNVTVGANATAENLAKVLEIEGATSLDASAFSSGNVDLAFGTPEDGKVKVTAGPKDANATTFFMRVRMTP